jgi:hypothetical protein
MSENVNNDENILDIIFIISNILVPEYLLRFLLLITPIFLTELRPMEN